MDMNVAEAIREAGVVGAGGAGFPTHIKAQGRADIVLANGAECEPLLRVDKILMQREPTRIVRGLKAMMEAVGAKEGVLCVKRKNHDAIAALEKAIGGESNLRLYLLENYYPAGDEQQIVYEVTGKVVPTGGIPLDVGAVVCNVTTLAQISDALDGKPVTERLVTVAGEVTRPTTFSVPVGAPLSALVKAAGGPDSLDGYALIVGGPATGKLCGDLSEPVLKTTGGVIVLKSTHPLIAQKTGREEMDLKMAKAACCQCVYCTLMCPRNLLGLMVEPHKAMRAAAMGKGALLGDPNGVFSCCDCGLCTYYACNFGLNPARMMTRFKQGLMSAGYKPVKQVKGSVAATFVKVPTGRLMARMGIAVYDADTPLDELSAAAVRLPLQMGIGASSVPVVKIGDTVQKGQLIAEIPEGRLGARIHASIGGTVSGMTDRAIEIKA
jgi:Na+-translocating ferredoxin:NAD+ oxidoreductase RnfC subunit